MQTIVELPEFLRKSDKLLKSSERQSIINYLASHPASGDIMQGTGGIRKLRWSALGKGKSSGVRVIYYYHSGVFPLFYSRYLVRVRKLTLAKVNVMIWLN